MAKKYIGYAPIHSIDGFWYWVHYSWNYIGGTGGYKTHITRRIGVRWFGHEWEKEIEIPYGELRF